MRVVTRRTGLSADLLRAWERRYEVVKPSRSEGGRRLYSDEDIERLRLLHRATLAGRDIGQVAELSMHALASLVMQDAEADAEAERASRGAQESELPRRHRRPTTWATAFCAVERLDAAGLDAIVRRAALALPLSRASRRARRPTARTRRDGLAPGIAAPRAWASGVSRPAAPPRPGDRERELPARDGKLVVAGPAGQVHEFGALLVAATAAVEGWRVTYLGTDLPAEDIAEAAVRTRPQVVGLSVVFPAGDPTLVDELRRLRAKLPRNVALVVGGAAASSYDAVLDEIGSVRLKDLEEFRTYLGTRRQAPRHGRSPR